MTTAAAPRGRTRSKLYIRCLLLFFCTGAGIVGQEEAEPRRSGQTSELERRVERLEWALHSRNGAIADGDRILLDVYWEDGFRLSSRDGSFELRVGGRFDVDAAFFEPNSGVEAAFGPTDDGVEFRRSRLSLSGRFYDRFKFKSSYDFSDGGTKFASVYFEVEDVPAVGALRIGNFKEPFGLERQTSSSNITFMERSLTAALNPRRETGLMASDSVLGRRATWAVGAFRDTNGNAFGQGDDGFSATARLTLVPWLEMKGRRLLHLGVAYSYRQFEQGMVRFRSRPEANLSPRFVDTVDFAADEAHRC